MTEIDLGVALSLVSCVERGPVGTLDFQEESTYESSAKGESRGQRLREQRDGNTDKVEETEKQVDGIKWPKMTFFCEHST